MIAPAVHFIYRGGGRNVIPVGATHVRTHESVTVIPEWLFRGHPNLVELICHENVERIGTWAFDRCRRLRRVVMPGVEVAEERAFDSCHALTHVACNKLEIVEARAFTTCKSLSGINLPSARIVERFAFIECKAMEDVKFGPLLESVGFGAFFSCCSLERITIPLKNGLFPYDDTFQECNNLCHINLVEGGILNDTVASLFLEEWRNDIRRVIDSINHDLPYAPAGDDDSGDDGEKTIVIRRWIKLVLSKIIRYKAQHRGLFNAYAAEPSLLHPGLPDEIVRNNVLPFLELPSHTFHGEDNTVIIDPNSADLVLPRELDANATGVDASDTSQPRMHLVDAAPASLRFAHI